VTSVMVDSSVLLAAFDRQDDEWRASASVLRNPSFTVSTLDLARYEVANVAVRSWRSPDDVATLLEAIERIGEDGGVVRSTVQLIAAAAELANESEISVYDAAYVVAARSGGRTLASCDVRDLVSRQLAVLPSALATEE
jgi:predicted nucleic acid-binding protein